MENLTSKVVSTDTDNKIEAIIRTIAIKHGIALGRNDPILVLHSLNELLISEFSAKQDELIQQFRVSLEEAADNFIKSMETKSVEILSEIEKSHSKLTNDFVENQISVVATSIADKCIYLAEPHNKKIYLYIKSLNSQLKITKRLIYFNLALSVFFAGLCNCNIFLN